MQVNLRNNALLLTKSNFQLLSINTLHILAEEFVQNIDDN